MIVTHNGIDESLGAPVLLEALSILSEHFITQHAGSNMKVLLHESFGVPVEFAADMGLHVTSHAPEYAALLARVPAGLQPAYITSMRRDEAARRPGKLVLAQIFLRFSPPRCSLRGAERRMLRLALEGMPDDAIANVLQIAPRTLKKRWADIYAAMEPVTGIAPGGEGGCRGAELRRHVMRYVREHPEELHAYDAAARFAAAPV